MGKLRSATHRFALSLACNQRGLGVALLLMLLSACAPETAGRGAFAFPHQTPHQTVIFAGTDEQAQVGPALQANITAFVGPGVSAIPSDFLERRGGGGGGSAIRHRMRSTAAFGLRHTRQMPLSRRAALYGMAELSVSRSDYVLPDGAGILVQPILIRTEAVNADFQGGAALRVPLGARVEGRVGAGGGVRLSRARSTISSPVVLSQHTSAHALPYATLNLTLSGTAPRAPELRLDLRHYPDFGPSGTLSLGARF